MDRSGLFAVYYPDVGWSRALEFFQEAAGGTAGGVILVMLMFAVPIAILGTLIAIGAELRRPRRRWRRLAGRPGWVASCASAFSWPIAGMAALGYGWITTGTSWGRGKVWDFDALVFATFGGFAVAVAWSTLALNRRWRPEPSWPDRLGRVVGGAWVVLFVLACYFLLGKRE